jgi:mannose-1-phosphate guanylyltransferase/phosphomannomutase
MCIRDSHETTLDEVVAALPPFYLRSRVVPCPFDRKGAVMRTVATLGETGEGQMVEGVRIPTDTGWALILPHATEAVVHVYAEGVDDASADATVERYVAAVQDAIANG